MSTIAKPDRPRSKRRAAWLSVALTASSFSVKGLVALATGSSAVLAETAHSFSDLLAAVIALLAVRAADRPADPMHPFGHQKLEHVSAVVEGLLLIIVAGFVAVQAARSFGQPVENSGLGIVVMMLSAGASFFVARRVARVAKEAHSAALEADSAHIAADVWSSLGTAAALGIIALTGWVQVDAIFGIAVLPIAQILRACVSIKTATDFLGFFLQLVHIIGPLQSTAATTTVAAA